MSSRSYDTEISAAREAYFVRPRVTISDETVSRLVRAGVDPSVACVDLEAQKLLLAAERGWSLVLADVAELEYKRFLSLHCWNHLLPHPLVPTTLIDILWHAHILDTKAYAADTLLVLGEYLHHFPYLGFGSDVSAERKRQAFEQTCELYEWTFGESYMRSIVALREGDA